MSLRFDYRERCYKAYVSTHWKYIHCSSKNTYDFYSRLYKKMFKNILPNDKQAKILDVACGPGHFLYFVQNDGYLNTRGIDHSKEVLRVAKKMGVENVQITDLFNYFKANRENFDMIIANDIIEHLRKDEVLRLLDSIYNSLLTGGRTLIRTINVNSLFGSDMVFMDFTHELGFTAESLSQVMRVCNFEDVKIYGEKPIANDFRSSIRSGIWWCITKIMKAYANIERGTGRGSQKRLDIFEPRIFAVGKRLNA